MIRLCSPKGWQRAEERRPEVSPGAADMSFLFDQINREQADERRNFTLIVLYVRQ